MVVLFLDVFILVSIFKQGKTWRALAHVFLGVNAVIAGFSLLQLFGYLPINQGGVRVDATFGNATYLAVYEIFHLFLILFCLVRFWQSRYWSKGIWLRILFFGYILLGLLDLVILYKTATRGGILGLGLGLIISAVLILWREKKVLVVRRAAWITLGLAAVVIVGFFAVKDSSWVARSETLSRLASISVNDRTTQSRFLVWDMSWQGFKERPLLGWGPENYILVFSKYYNPAMYNQELWFDRSHNVVFDWLINAGALGLLAYLSLFGVSLYLLWWKKNSLITTERALITGLLAAYFFHNLFVFDNLVSYLFFFALLGYIHFRSTESSSNTLITASSSGFQLPFAPLIVVVAVIFIPVFYWGSVKPMLANQTLIEALSQQNYPDKALVSFKQVFASRTFASTEASEHLINTALGVVQNQSVSGDIRTGIISLARDQILETIKREPGNARYPYFAGSFFLRLGLLDEAEKSLVEARRLSPRKQVILFELGNFYLVQKKYDQALVVFREAYELAPNFGEARKIYALGAIYDDKLPLATELLSEGAKDNPAFLLDERLVQAYGAINRPDALSALWQEALDAHPDFKQALLDFIDGLRKRGVIE